MIRFSLPLLSATLLTWATPSAAQANPETAFVYANNPRANQYTPSKAYARNPSGQPVRIMRKGTGQYEVLFSRMGQRAEGGNVQVTSYGSGPEHCKVQQWVQKNSDLSINVRCFRGSSPADAPFSLLFTPKNSAQARGASTPRFAWVSQARKASYTADRGYSRNQDRPVRIERQRTGRYTLRFDGVDQATAQGGNVQVTAYGNGPEWCKVVSWSWDNRSLSVQTACFNAQGRNVDTQMSVLFTPGR